MSEIISSHNFNFSPNEPSGEGLTLTTYFLDNGDRKHGLPTGIFTNHKITLQSYGNSASLELYGITITPELLRKLANELEIEESKVKKQLTEKQK